MAVSKIMDKNDRIVAIAEEVKSPRRYEPFHYRGEMKELPVVRLSINLPIYRMKNGRTQVEQYRYLEEASQPEDFFEKGEENISAQQAQHKILLKIAKDERGPIYQELEHVATQRESLLLTFDGVVLNGNRRLATMRDLFGQDTRYESFSHVDAAILPREAIEQDLELIEAELQMAPETKLEYGWIERRLKLYHHAEVLKIPRKQIKETYRFSREADINIELQQLKLAEEYLEMYLGQPRAYREVAQSEQLFKNLEQQLRGKQGEEAEIRRLAGYLLAKEARNLGDRVYRYNPIFGKDFEKVMNRFAEYEGIDITAPLPNEPISDSPSSDDPLNDLHESKTSSYAALKPIFENQENTEETAEKLSNVFDSLKIEEKDQNTKQDALKRVQNALRILNDIDLSAADPATFNGIKSQLDTVISVSKNLKSEINNMPNGDVEEL